MYHLSHEVLPPTSRSALTLKRTVPEPCSGAGYIIRYSSDIEQTYSCTVRVLHSRPVHSLKLQSGGNSYIYIAQLNENIIIIKTRS